MLRVLAHFVHMLRNKEKLLKENAELSKNQELPLPNYNKWTQQNASNRKWILIISDSGWEVSYVSNGFYNNEIHQDNAEYLYDYIKELDAQKLIPEWYKTRTK
jgi:uncharacterized protein YjlB